MIFFVEFILFLFYDCHQQLMLEWRSADIDDLNWYLNWWFKPFVFSNNTGIIQDSSLNDNSRIPEVTLFSGVFVCKNSMYITQRKEVKNDDNTLQRMHYSTLYRILQGASY